MVADMVIAWRARGVWIDSKPAKMGLLILMLANIAVNMVATGLIAFRAWIHYKAVKSIGQKKTRAGGILLLLVESGVLYALFQSLSWRDSRVEPLTQQQVLDGLNKLEARSVTEEKEEKEQQEQADLTGGSEARLTLRRKDGNGWSLLCNELDGADFVCFLESYVEGAYIVVQHYKPGCIAGSEEYNHLASHLEPAAPIQVYSLVPKLLHG
ncbi:hypothetical protein BDP27DRAFT_1367096 [Rhodocollybia butyracea]|uniref:Uncharacterized protein n=1 Tax=Rhodocollybia butyracea TaxID=206335 RepID=A0A9P5U3I1_9AGAR|nr:hypothetical protein BDP27DRAFT_1367096 [Rhodocollybia butyracea]